MFVNINNVINMFFQIVKLFQIENNLFTKKM